MLALVSSVARAQFIHIFEVQDENRAPKSDLFDPSQYKYVSPAQLQKQQAANKLQQTQAAPVTVKPAPSRQSVPKPPPPPTVSVPEMRRMSEPTPSSVLYSTDARLNEISNGFSSEKPTGARSRHQNAYSTAEAASAPPSSQTPMTYMQPISRILSNISANEISGHIEAELRKQIRMHHQQQQPQSENRYSRGTTPLRVSAQNQRQYVVSVGVVWTGAGSID